MDRAGKKCVIYSRVSTEMQVDGFSLAAQKTCLTTFAKREELRIVGEYEDAGKSGKNIEGRPSFKRMINDIKSGLKVDYVVVYKLSRFGRNAADVLNSLELIQDYGVNLICTDEGIDSSQASGRLLISVLSAVAQIERENILEQTMNGRREKARQGLWNGGYAPYGYKLVNGKVEVSEEEAKIVKMIFDLYVNEKKGLTRIAKYLNDQGIAKVIHDGTKVRWTRSAINYMINNQMYTGKLVYGKYQMTKVKGQKDKAKRKASENIIVVDGQHEAIIDDKIWEEAQKIKDGNSIFMQKCLIANKPHPLSGLMRCPVCGGNMTITGNVNKNKNITYYSYRCSKNKNINRVYCSHSIKYKEEILEELVDKTISKIVVSEKFANDVALALKDDTDKERLNKELENYESTLSKYIANKKQLEYEIDFEISPGDKKRDILKTRLNTIYEAIFDLEEKIEDLKLRIDSINEKTITVEDVMTLLNNFNKIIDSLNREEKKELYTSLIEEIVPCARENNNPLYKLKSIKFKFPININGKIVDDIKIKYDLKDENIVTIYDPPARNQYTSRIFLGVDIIDYIYKHHNIVIDQPTYSRARRNIMAMLSKDYNEEEMKFIRRKCPSIDVIHLVIDAYIHLNILPDNAEDIIFNDAVISSEERLEYLNHLEYNKSQLKSYVSNVVNDKTKNTTYRDIAEYIKKEYNLSISHRQIGYTKCLVGLDTDIEKDQINYSLISLKTFQICTNALKYFKMIDSEYDITEVLEFLKDKKGQ